uniref:Uncharacterized protein n=1 Tax=Tanacetum cinerariifolium TaxID=118510 RepID=A0A699JBC1_TANCI|nr:hypothetical protein [Tanacetum cinerariifolium]
MVLSFTSVLAYLRSGDCMRSAFVFSKRFVSGHREFDIRMNRLVGEMNEACQDRIDFVQELESVVGVTVTAKTVVFLKEMMDKAHVSEKYVVSTVSDINKIGTKHKKSQSIAALPICDELRRSVNSSDWESMFILRCHRDISKDLRLARKINALCARVTTIIDERENLVGELDILVGRSVPGKMAEFMKQVQGNDIPNLMKMKILKREFELRAQEKGIFIDKLKGNMEF